MRTWRLSWLRTRCLRTRSQQPWPTGYRRQKTSEPASAISRASPDSSEGLPCTKAPWQPTDVCRGSSRWSTELIGSPSTLRCHRASTWALNNSVPRWELEDTEVRRNVSRIGGHAPQSVEGCERSQSGEDRRCFRGLRSHQLHQGVPVETTAGERER